MGVFDINYSTENIWNNIILDFRQPISYLLPAIIITMAGMLIYKIYKKEKARIFPYRVFLLIYIEILLQTAFFSREPGSRKQIDLHLFGTWGQTAIAHAYFMENIIMFIPFGVLVPMVFKRMRNLRFCVFVGFVCSCGIELSQLITQRGYCQLDDVVTNTAGMLIGWIIWNIKTRFPNFTEHGMQHSLRIINYIYCIMSEELKQDISDVEIFCFIMAAFL